MAVSIVGYSSAAGTSVTVPAHQINDLIVIFAWASSTTVAPTIPAAGGLVPAYGDLGITPATCPAGKYIIASCFAAATNDTSGTWTNAVGMAVVVLRGVCISSPQPINGRCDSSGSASTSWSFRSPDTLIEASNGYANSATAWPQRDFSGNSIVLNFMSSSGVTAFGSAPSGWTQLIADTSAKICVNQQTSATTVSGTVSQTGNTNVAYNACTVEVLNQDPTMVVVKGQLTTAGVTSAPMPVGVAAGDLVIGWVSASSTTIPTVPAAGGTVPTWNTLYSNSSPYGLRVVWATGISGMTSGTWANAHSFTFLSLFRQRGWNGIQPLYLGSLAANANATSTTSYTGPSMVPLDQSGVGMSFHAAINGGSLSTTTGPGAINKTGTAINNFVAPKQPAANGGAMSYTEASASGWEAQQIEIQGNLIQNFFNM